MRLLLGNALLLTIAFATAGCQSVNQDNRQLEQFLSDQFDLDSYETKSADLNGDGVLEHVILSTGPGYCGATGACTLFVIRNHEGRFESIGRIPAVRPWVTLLPTTSNGWQDLGFVVKADPLTHYHGVIEFDSQQYRKRATEDRLDWDAPSIGEVLFERSR